MCDAVLSPWNCEQDVSCSQCREDVKQGVGYGNSFCGFRLKVKGKCSPILADSANPGDRSDPCLIGQAKPVTGSTSEEEGRILDIDQM